jgi:hypothetical protein
MNASTHSSTGVSPAQIVYGNAVKLDRNLLPLEHTPHSTNPHEYIADLVKVQKEILNIAIRNQEETDLFHLSKRGGKEITEFPPNSYVLVNYEGEGHKPPSKLHTNLRGPVKVISSNGPIYTVQDLATEKLLDFNVKLLHPFDFDAAIVDPREVAKHDEDYFDIDKIEDHKFVGTKKNRTDLEFLILFEGDKKASWQPWSIDLGKNEKIINILETIVWLDIYQVDLHGLKIILNMYPQRGQEIRKNLHGQRNAKDVSVVTKYNMRNPRTFLRG